MLAGMDCGEHAWLVTVDLDGAAGVRVVYECGRCGAAREVTGDDLTGRGTAGPRRG